MLDENNGRFCITPEYPNGTYAYFATFDSTAASDGIFKNFKRPTFPYLIGDKFNSRPNRFNFSRVSNQLDFNLNGKRDMIVDFMYSNKHDKKVMKTFFKYCMFLEKKNPLPKECEFILNHAI